jgi:transposase
MGKVDFSHWNQIPQEACRGRKSFRPGLRFFGPETALRLLPSRALSSVPAVRLYGRFAARSTCLNRSLEVCFPLMNEREIFGLALGLQGTPWKVVEVKLDTGAGSLDLYLDFPPGSRFARPSDGRPCPVYDTAERTWRHLNFFQYECHIHAWVPRIDGGEPDGVKTVEVPWARPGSGFTLLMEAMMMVLTQTGMTVAEAARTLGENDHRLWRVLLGRVEAAHEKMDVSGVRQLTVDETSVKRGHEYVTVFCEPGQKRPEGKARVLFVTEGKDAATVEKGAGFLAAKGVPAGQIEEVCADMSPAYRAGVQEHFPGARLVFDFFHVVGLLTTAVDQVRRRESKAFPELLKGTRYLWLKNEANLTPEQQRERTRLCRCKLQTAKAFCQLSAFQDLLKARDVEEAKSGLKWWYNWACHSRIPEIIKAARSIKAHWDGVVAYLETRLTNACAESINGIIQTVKRKSRGFRNFEYFRAMIYLVGSNLKFDLPNPIPTYPHKTS